MKTYHIYTDGSHFKNGGSGRLGIGGILIDPDKNIPLGEKISDFSIEILKDYVLVHYGTEDCSNPTMELLAALTALREFKEFLKKSSKVVLMADYEGVRNWISGTWKPKKSYIIKLVDEIKKEISSQGLNIEFKWVKGHQKITEKTPEAHWNQVVDKLAKGGKI